MVYLFNSKPVQKYNGGTEFGVRSISYRWEYIKIFKEIRKLSKSHVVLVSKGVHQEKSDWLSDK